MARMKGIPVRCVEADDRPVPMVTFCPWQTKEWTLPWSRFDALSSTHEEELERVDLFFPHHQVILVGENLHDIMEDIRTFHVYCMRDLPPSHRASFSPADTFITRLEVRLQADPTGRR